MNAVATLAPCEPFVDADQRVHVITRYADVAALAASPRVLVPAIERDVAMRLERHFPGRYRALSQWGEGMLVHLNGPPHERARDRAQRIIRQAQQGQTAPVLEAEAAALLAAQGAAGTLDGCALATAFIDGLWCGLLGLRLDEIGELVAEAEAFMLGWSQISALARYQERNRQAEALMGRAVAGLGEGQCPWSAGGQSALDGPLLLVILAVANGTVKHMMTNVLHLLATQPDEQERLRQNPGRVAAFVEEALRMHGSVRFRDRIAGPEGVEEYGIAPGARIRLHFDSAGRDGSVYPDPDRFDPARHMAGARVPPVLAFAGGPHLCAGRFQARAQMVAMVRAIVGAHHLALADGPPEPVTDPGFEGFHALPLRLAALR